MRLKREESDLFDDCRNHNLFNKWVIDFDQSFSTSIFLPTAIANCYNPGKYRIYKSEREEDPKEQRKMQSFLQTRSNAEGHARVGTYGMAKMGE